MDTNRRHVEAALARQIAVAADADPRTVARVMLGGRAKGMVDTRIRRALAERGITAPTPCVDTYLPRLSA